MRGGPKCRKHPLLMLSGLPKRSFGHWRGCSSRWTRRTRAASATGTCGRYLQPTTMLYENSFGLLFPAFWRVVSWELPHCTGVPTHGQALARPRPCTPGLTRLVWTIVLPSHAARATAVAAAKPVQRLLTCIAVHSEMAAKRYAHTVDPCTLCDVLYWLRAQRLGAHRQLCVDQISCITGVRRTELRPTT